MKTSRPQAEDLLVIARQEMLDTLMPEVSGALKYQVLITANAMRISAREISDGAATEQQAEAAIARFYSGRTPDHVGQPDEEALAGEIRDRQLRGEDPDLYQLLLSLTEGKLRISNPKYLKKAPEKAPEKVPEELSKNR